MTQYRIMPTKDELPYALYSAAQVRHFDDLAINQYGISGFELMGRAGKVAFDTLTKTWPDAKQLLVICGSGNNAGDGFVVAKLALESGMDVKLFELGDNSRMSEETQRYRQAYLDISGQIIEAKKLPEPIIADVIVDGLFGTGLNAEVQGHWADAIRAVNRSLLPVLALDLPSGLQADTGRILGTAIKAEVTVSFIGLKQGMLTSSGRDCCGDIRFHALDIPARVYASEILNCRRIDWHKLKHLISKRHRSAHKGDFGHVLIVGGNLGYSGAVRLAAEAALRSGAGLVSVATRKEHAAMLNLGRPEIMVHAVESANDLKHMLEKASVVVLGPGLGTDAWALSVFKEILSCQLPMIIDADGLNLLSQNPVSFGNDRKVILTPHPGEAARLLKKQVVDIEEDRFQSVSMLQQHYNCTVVLKGSGSLIASRGSQPIALCSDGNPGMATGGMGDVLAGITGTMLSQYEDEDMAASLAVALHASAADIAAQAGEIGMLASDLFKPIRRLLNNVS